MNEPVGSFEFATAGRILFGPGRLRELPGLVGLIGTRVLLVVGATLKRSEPVQCDLEAEGFDFEVFRVHGEPTVEAVANGAARAIESDSEVVVGLGGGSVIDAAKAVAALATNTGDPLQYLEVIGGGKPLGRTPLPTIAVPTTAGTGAEVTRNAVLHSPSHGAKVSLRHARMLPHAALVDPEITRSVPPDVTASTGMDALTQLIESYLSLRATALTDAICRAAIPRVARSLERTFINGDDLEARTDVSFGSLSSGLALANSGLGAVHGLAAPIGGMFGVAHGAVCAALLPVILEVNFDRRCNAVIASLGERYAELAVLVTGRPTAQAEDLMAWVGELSRSLQIRTLGEMGIRDTDHASIAQNALNASSMKGNPVRLGQSDLIEALSRA